MFGLKTARLKRFLVKKCSVMVMQSNQKPEYKTDIDIYPNDQPMKPMKLTYGNVIKCSNWAWSCLSTGFR